MRFSTLKYFLSMHFKVLVKVAVVVMLACGPAAWSMIDTAPSKVDQACPAMRLALDVLADLKVTNCRPDAPIH